MQFLKLSVLFGKSINFSLVRGFELCKGLFMNDLLVGYFIRVLLLEGLHSRHLLRCQLDDGCLLDFQFFLDFQGVLLD